MELLPVPVSTPGFDNAPYTTCSQWYTKDPETGIRNAGNYRGQVKARNRMGIYPGPGGQHIYTHWLKCKERGIPMDAALVIGGRDRGRLLWFVLLPLLAMLVLARVGRWSRANDRGQRSAGRQGAAPALGLPRRRVLVSVGILLVLIFSKYFYLASIGSYFTFYLMDKFRLAVRDAQLHLFLFQLAVAVGTFLGGPLGDRIGRKYVIWLSILGASPFTLLLPYVGLSATTALSVLIGLVLSSAFSAILVYAQELIPGKVGMISGLFFGFAFGMGGIGSAVLGRLADATSITFVYRVCAFLPLLGLITAFLPNLKRKDSAQLA